MKPKVKTAHCLRPVGCQRPGSSFLLFFLLMFLLLGSTSGCTAGVIAFPSADIKYYEAKDGTGRAVKIQAWGICLDTNAADAGFVIGGTNKIYYFEGPNSMGKHVNLPDLEHPDSYKLKHTDQDLDYDLATLPTVALVNQSTGIMIHANPGRIGVSLGLSKHASLRLPADFNGILFIDTNTEKPLLGKLYIRKEKN
ncbi:MAG: hypothetical protein ACYSYL_07340 [Planctomycetota bacterium]